MRQSLPSSSTSPLPGSADGLLSENPLPYAALEAASLVSLAPIAVLGLPGQFQLIWIKSIHALVGLDQVNTRISTFVGPKKVLLPDGSSG